HPHHFSYSCFFSRYRDHRDLHSFPTRRSSDLRSGMSRIPTGRPARWPPSGRRGAAAPSRGTTCTRAGATTAPAACTTSAAAPTRSEEHTSELQSLAYLVCRLLLEKKKKIQYTI